MKKRYLSFVMSLLMLMSAGCRVSEKVSSEQEESILVEEAIDNLAELEEIKEEKIPVEKDIVVSAVGDCTLGTDTNFGYERSFTNILDDTSRDFSYFFDGVYDILSNDNLTIANLETTFTDSNNRVDKKFNFKGDKDYTNILLEGSVEAVNLANNHTYDYGEEGYNDTIAALNEAGIPYFGYEDYQILDVDGIKIGLAGLSGWNEESAKKNTEKAINYFKENETDLIIMTYHWGIEYEYEQSTTQENIGRYAIDLGADLVVGHHPHILEGIECYQGKYIVYSLGNFVFGGNKNPIDKDTMIFQQTFHYVDDVLTDTSINIIPCSLSSKSDRNDYRPKILEEEEKEKVLEKIYTYSKNLDDKIE